MANRYFAPLKVWSVAKRILALTHGVKRQNGNSYEVPIMPGSVPCPPTRHPRSGYCHCRRLEQSIPKLRRYSSWRRELDLNSAIKHGLMLFLVLLAPLQAPAQRRIVTLPFRSVNSLILVEASIDGRPVTLLVDTGANKTILNARSIGRVQLPVSQPVNHGPGIIGNALCLRVDVEIAHRFLFSQPVSVMNLEELSKSFQIPFDGLLGQDILNQFRSVRIDYKAHVIELEA
jgi:hypothetical protein